MATIAALACTRTKGLYQSDNWTFDAGVQPRWYHVGQELDIFQIDYDLDDPVGLQVCVKGTQDAVYIRAPSMLGNSWIQILTSAQIKALIGTNQAGTIYWAEYGTKKPGHIYVLWNYNLTLGGIWCIRSTDYGATWTANVIYAGLQNYGATNIDAGLVAAPGDPYVDGDVLYCSIRSGLAASRFVYRSFNDGVNWSTVASHSAGNSQYYVFADPNNQKISYTSGRPANEDMYRSVNYAAGYAIIDGATVAGPDNIAAFWMDRSDSDTIRVHRAAIYYSNDNGATWGSSGALPECQAMFGTSPANLIIGKWQPIGPGDPNKHLVQATVDDGTTILDKSGDNASVPGGAGDSIGYDAGGISVQGVILKAVSTVFTVGGGISNMQNFLAGHGGIHVQPCGPGTVSHYLGCHGVGDIAAPKGDITLLWCPDQNKSGAFRVKGSYQGAPGPVTTTITTEVTAVADWLEKLKCPATFYIIKNLCGKRSDFFVQPGNRVFVFDTGTITNEGLTNVLAMTPDNENETQQTFDLSGLGLIRVWPIGGQRITITETEDVTGITACSEDDCPNLCGSCADKCDSMYAGTTALVGSATNTADVLESIDGGVVWAATATDPFGGGEDIQPIVCVKLNATTWRLIAGCGTTDPADNAKINYSDDGGDTWAGEIEVPGGTTGAYFSTPNSIYAIDKRHIWAVTYEAAENSVNFSDDAGETWTNQGNNVGAAQPLNAVHFCDENHGWVGGEANTIARTDDGGTVWDAVAGPAAQAAANIMSLVVITPSHIILGYGDGELWQTLNGLDNTPTWEQVPTDGPFTSINSIKFNNEYIGYFVGEKGSGNNTLERSFDGGYTWEAVELPTNAGLNDVLICSNNKVFFTGDISGGTGFVGKAE